MEKVLVGLSGGVDSAAVALILKEQGYEVAAVHFSFCGGDSPERARQVAEALGIPFYHARRQKRFHRCVIAPFVASYGRGETPNPCIECNRIMKFACLLEMADRLGIEKVATGHYAGIRKGENGRFQLLRGQDGGKDQSYFLRKLTQRQLSRILFPLADLDKDEIRERAAFLVPPVQKESMEICFIPDSDTARFVENHGGETPEGNFVDRNGKVLGRHKGTSHYTVGQRRGLGVAMGERYFVTEIRPETDEVVLGRAEELLVSEMKVEELHFVSCTKKEVAGKALLFQGRSRKHEIPCRVSWTKKGARVYFDAPVRRIAPGQSVCFYEGNVLLFGGVIPRDEAK